MLWTILSIRFPKVWILRAVLCHFARIFGTVMCVPLPVYIFWFFLGVGGGFCFWLVVELIFSTVVALMLLLFQLFSSVYIVSKGSWQKAHNMTCIKMSHHVPCIVWVQCEILLYSYEYEAQVRCEGITSKCLPLTVHVSMYDVTASNAFSPFLSAAWNKCFALGAHF